MGAEPVRLLSWEQVDWETSAPSFVKKMHMKLNLNIHFHQQDEISFSLENNCSCVEDKFGEILLFCAIALRALTTLSKGETSRSLASFLAMSKKKLSEEFADHRSPGPKTIECKGPPGRKRFEARLDFNQEDASIGFIFKAKGFGFLAKGIDYYLPTSVIMLLQYLTKKRLEDKKFLLNLSMAASMCGSFYLNDQVSIANQGALALKIAQKVSNPKGQFAVAYENCALECPNILSANFKAFIDEFIADKALRTAMITGYTLRCAEACSTYKKLHQPIGTAKKILEEKITKKEKIAKLATFFDEHNKIGISDAMKPYALLQFGKIKRYFSEYVEDYVESNVNRVAEDRRGIFFELSFRNAAFGYAYKVAEELADFVK